MKVMNQDNNSHLASLTAKFAALLLHALDELIFEGFFPV